MRRFSLLIAMFSMGSSLVIAAQNDNQSSNNSYGSYNTLFTVSNSYGSNDITFSEGSKVDLSDIVKGDYKVLNKVDVGNTYNLSFNTNSIYQLANFEKLTNLINTEINVRRITSDDALFENNKNKFLTSISSNAFPGLKGTKIVDQQEIVKNNSNTGNYSVNTRIRSILDGSDQVKYKIIDVTEKRTDSKGIQKDFPVYYIYAANTDYLTNPPLIKIENATIKHSTGFDNNSIDGTTIANAISVSTALEKINNKTYSGNEKLVAMRYSALDIGSWKNSDQQYCTAQTCDIKDSSVWKKSPSDWDVQTISNKSDTGSMIAKVKTDQSEINSAENSGIFSQLIQYIFQTDNNKDDVGNQIILSASNNVLKSIDLNKDTVSYKKANGEDAKTTLTYTAWAPVSIYNDSVAVKKDSGTYTIYENGQNVPATFKRQQADTDVNFVNVVFGELTDPTNLPKGSATYSGNVHGTAMAANYVVDSMQTGTSGSIYDVGGKMNMTADFNTSKISGNMDININDAAKTNISNIQFANGTIDSANSAFQANLQHASIDTTATNPAQIQGNFHGPAGQEIGSSFAFKTADYLVSGITVGAKTN